MSLVIMHAQLCLLHQPLKLPWPHSVLMATGQELRNTKCFRWEGGSLTSFCSLSPPSCEAADLSLGYIPSPKLLGEGGNSLALSVRKCRPLLRLSVGRRGGWVLLPNGPLNYFHLLTCVLFLSSGALGEMVIGHLCRKPHSLKS